VRALGRGADFDPLLDQRIDVCWLGAVAPVGELLQSGYLVGELAAGLEAPSSCSSVTSGLSFIRTMC
jgi:hypothetical protein